MHYPASCDALVTGIILNEFHKVFHFMMKGYHALQHSLSAHIQLLSERLLLQPIWPQNSYKMLFCVLLVMLLEYVLLKKLLAYNIGRHCQIPFNRIIPINAPKKDMGGRMGVSAPPALKMFHHVHSVNTLFV